jgi:thiol-disulfide isomerase/thioredoxin
MIPGAQTTPKTTLLTVTEANFGRRVLAAPLPTLVLFGAPSCPASRALKPLLQELAELHAPTLRIASIDAERAAWLAEQFGVTATPTLLVVQDGEIVSRVVGFAPLGLLRLLCEQIATNTLPRDPFWSPVEATFEDVVVMPLLERWDLTCVRQAPCPAPARGRIDMLVYERSLERPLTLFENKRQVASTYALGQASAQAHRYARALGLPSFVVAAPAGLWIYRCAGQRAVEIHRLTILELQEHPDSVPALLRHLAGY